LKSNKESVITKIVVFYLEYIAKSKKGIVNNLFKNVYKYVLKIVQSFNKFLSIIRCQ